LVFCSFVDGVSFEEVEEGGKGAEERLALASQARDRRKVRNCANIIACWPAMKACIFRVLEGVVPRQGGSILWQLNRTHARCGERLGVSTENSHSSNSAP
jgi:hypothetical protein